MPRPPAETKMTDIYVKGESAFSHSDPLGLSTDVHGSAEWAVVIPQRTCPELSCARQSGAVTQACRGARRSASSAASPAVSATAPYARITGGLCLIPIH